MQLKCLTLVHSGYYNKIVFTGQFINHRNALLIVLEAEKSKIQVPVDLASREGTFCMTSHGRRASRLPEDCYIRIQIPFIRTQSSRPYHLPKPHFLMRLHWGQGSTDEFWRDSNTQTTATSGRLSTLPTGSIRNQGYLVSRT